MGYTKIQLMALQVPKTLSLPFELYSVIVPEHWKQLFTKFQQKKLGKDAVMPPIECLNQALQLLIDDILFPCKNAFTQKSTQKWLYSKNNQIADEIARIVTTWVLVAFKDMPPTIITEAERQEILSLSGQDLQFNKVELPDPVWTIENGKLQIDSLYYDLIPYLLANAVASEFLPLIDPNTGNIFEQVAFYECVLNNSKEVISWPPMMITKKIKKKDQNEEETEVETTHYYSYCLEFSLQYTADGEPYIVCEYGIRRWVSWELKYLSQGANVCISPTDSKRFAACKLKYNGKNKSIYFEGNLVSLLNQLAFKDKFTAQNVIKNPYRIDKLDWGIIYHNAMSRSHHVNAGLHPTDIQIFHQACMQRFQQHFGDSFPLLETYERCDNKKLLEKSRKHYEQVETFIKSHFADKTQTLPFYIPPNLKLVALVQSSEAEKIIQLLANKYGITDVTITSLGALGSPLEGDNWQTNCKNRIKAFRNNAELKSIFSDSSTKKILTLIEILPKDDFWKNAKEDPKPFFRPALARLGSVVDHFTPKEKKDKDDILDEEALKAEIEKRKAEKEAAKQEGKSVKESSLKSGFIHRIESTLLSGLSMTGAYLYPKIEIENFPSNVASVGVYVIPFYIGKNNTQYLPVAVRMANDGVTAKAYNLSEWIDIHEFQVKMASGEFKSISLNKQNIQDWVVNNLFNETKQPTLYCFDADNLRTKGLPWLQKKHWSKHQLALGSGENNSFEWDKNITFTDISKYPNVRVACITTPETSEVPTYRACNKEDEIKGHTEGVFFPSSKNAEWETYLFCRLASFKETKTLALSLLLITMLQKWDTLAECGYYYLSNQRPDSRSSGIRQKSKLVPMPYTKGKKKGELKDTNASDQGYNPRGIFLNLTLQKGDCFSDWATFVQCLRLYTQIQYLDATNLPDPLHRAKALQAYRPFQAIQEP